MTKLAFVLDGDRARVGEGGCKRTARIDHQSATIDDYRAIVGQAEIVAAEVADERTRPRAVHDDRARPSVL
jgi:hypothetical protein